MLNRLFKALAIVILAGTATSCNHNAEVKPPFAWGKYDSYDDFLWKKCAPDTLRRTLVFDFNEDARNYLDRSVIIGIYKKDDNGNLQEVRPEEAQLVIGNEPCPDNRIAVSADSNEVELGIVFTPQAEDKIHCWYFKIIDNGGLDRINDTETASPEGALPILRDFQIEKHHRWNPLAEICSIAGIALLGALLVWLLILRPIFYPRFRVGKITLTGPAPYIKTVMLRHCYKMVLTGKHSRQGFLSRLFKGQIAYEVNPLWNEEIVITPRNKKSVHIRPAKCYYIMTRILMRNEEYTLENENTRDKTIIKIS